MHIYIYVYTHDVNVGSNLPASGARGRRRDCTGFVADARSGWCSNRDAWCVGKLQFSARKTKNLAGKTSMEHRIFSKEKLFYQGLKETQFYVQKLFCYGLTWLNLIYIIYATNIWTHVYIVMSCMYVCHVPITYFCVRCTFFFGHFALIHATNWKASIFAPLPAGWCPSSIAKLL